MTKQTEEEELLAEVQGLPEVPAVAHFCSLFHTILGLEEFDIHHLETALVDCRRRPTKYRASHVDDEARFAAADFLNSLCVKLLRGCLPQHSSRIQQENYLTYAKQMFRSRAEELEEDSGGVIVPPANPFDDAAEEDVEELSELSLAGRVRVLRLLTDYRLEGEDIPERLKDMEAESLRVEPLGADSAGRVYWYFYGTRLYVEVVKRRQKKKKKKIEEKEEKLKQKAKGGKKVKKKDGGKRSSGKSVKVVEEEEEEEEEEEGGLPAPGWYLSCCTEQDWQQLADRLRVSRKKPDRELLATLETNFLPEIARMFAAQEREERLRLLMANKRSSSRIDRRRQEAEERQLRDQQLEDQLTAAQEQEEQRRADQEKENAQRRRKMRVIARGGGGDVENVEKEDVDESPAEDREERKRRREVQQDVLRRWQEMEMDHDYLPAKQRKHFRFY